MMEENTIAIIRDLKGRWGIRGIFSKMLTMANYYHTSCVESTNAIANLCTKKGAKFTFFICGSQLDAHLPLVQRLSKEHEVGCHGYLHRSYTSISKDRAKKDVQLGWNKFHRLALPCKGFRAPYGRYPKYIVPLVAQLFDYDAGMERAEYITDRMLETCHILAVSRISDDYLFDKMQCSNTEALAMLTSSVNTVVEYGGAIMFNLHPLRMGRKDRIGVLNKLINEINETSGWMPTISAFLDNNRICPKNKQYTVLLTGDIDQWNFRSYVRRIF